MSRYKVVPLPQTSPARERRVQDAAPAMERALNEIAFNRELDIDQLRLTAKNVLSARGLYP